ncbi:unnamed protein product [Closterium sp. NIES-54]
MVRYAKHLPSTDTCSYSIHLQSQKWYTSPKVPNPLPLTTRPLLWTDTIPPPPPLPSPSLLPLLPLPPSMHNIPHLPPPHALPHSLHHHTPVPYSPLPHSSLRRRCQRN